MTDEMTTINYWLNEPENKKTIGFPEKLSDIPTYFNANPTEIKYLHKLLKKHNIDYRIVRKDEKTTKSRMGKVKNGFDFKLTVCYRSRGDMK